MQIPPNNEKNELRVGAVVRYISPHLRPNKHGRLEAHYHILIEWRETGIGNVWYQMIGTSQEIKRKGSVVVTITAHETDIFNKDTHFDCMHLIQVSEAAMREAQCEVVGYLPEHIIANLRSLLNYMWDIPLPPTGRPHHKKREHFPQPKTPIEPPQQHPQQKGASPKQKEKDAQPKTAQPKHKPYIPEIVITQARILPPDTPLTPNMLLTFGEGGTTKTGKTEDAPAPKPVAAPTDTETPQPPTPEPAAPRHKQQSEEVPSTPPPKRKNALKELIQEAREQGLPN